MGGSSFTAGEESVTLDFANAEITKNDESIELSDLAEGDILTVEVGSNNTAAARRSSPWAAARALAEAAR